MKANLPPAPPSYDQSYFTRAFSSLDTVLGFSVSRIEAVDGVLLQSPNGSVYKLSVNNAGTLTTTAVPLGQSGAPPY
jgi:hypothetical protein